MNRTSQSQLNPIFFILCILLSSISHVHAQRDKVYLKNDTKLVGKLVLYRPGDSVQIQLANGQILGFSDKEVQKIVMEDLKTNKPYEFREKGVFNVTYFGLSFGKTHLLWSPADTYLGINVENVTGYQFNRFVGAGLGIGYDNYYVTGIDANVVSVFSAFRGYMSKHPTTGYYSLSGGIGFPIVNTKDNLNLSGHRGGFLVHPAVGLRFGASARMNFFADIGVKIQRIYFNQITEWTENHYKITYQRWILRGGLMF